MNPSTYIPRLFIGIGETHAFFTLRETYLATVPGPGADGNAVVNGVYQGTFEERSFHHFNLSQEPADAVAKAQEYADRMGLKLTADSYTLEGQMRDIQRATAEELARREEAMKLEREYWAEQREASRIEKFHNAANGIFAFGPYKGKEYKEAPRGYLTWLADKVEEFEAGSILRATGEAVQRLVPELLLPKPHPTKHVGTEGKRATFDVEVIRVSHFTRQGFGYGNSLERVWIVTMMTADGGCLVSMTPSFRAEEGEKLKIKATVKEHGEYKGQAQTKVQRIVVLEEKEVV